MAGKIIFPELLKEFLCRDMILEMVINKRFEMMFKVHLQRPVPPRFQLRRLRECMSKGFP